MKNELIRSWELSDLHLNEGMYISKLDTEHFNFELLDQRNSENKINFRRIPQPFWGNIDNPAIIILFTNPGDKPLEEEEETSYKTYREALFDNLKGKRFDYLSEIIEDEINSNRWDTHSAKYWHNAFNDIKNEVSKFGFSDPIGEFEFHGYVSKNHKAFTHKRKKEIKKKYLPTQEIMFKYIGTLIKTIKPIVVIARAEKLWIEAVPELKNISYIKLNNPQSGSFNRGNLKKDDFSLIVDVIKNKLK